MDLNEAHTHEKLVEVLLKREKYAGFGMVSWGVVMLIIAAVPVYRGNIGFNFTSCLLAVPISLFFLIGLVRFSLGSMSVNRVFAVPFLGGDADIFMGEGPRLHLLAVTADNGRELSWDIFDPELIQKEKAATAWRLDHIDERFFKKIYLSVGLKFNPKLFGRRLYSWLVVLSPRVTQITIRAKNQSEAAEYRACVVTIELVRDGKRGQVT